MRRQLTIGANVDKEGHACCDLKLVQPNILGSKASATATVSSTATAAREFSLRFSSPVWRYMGDLEFSRKTREETSSGYSSICTQGLFQIGGGLNQLGSWRLDADWSLRDLDPKGGPQHFPSMQLQQEQLRSMKTSLKYSTSRYAEIFSGLLHAKVTMELAGPPGNVSFFKGEATVKAGLPFPALGRLWHGHLSMGCGLLLPAGRSCPQDRFHLGGASGASSLKGFAERGAEPREFCLRKTSDDKMSPSECKECHQDAQGGEAVASFFAAVSTPCEFLRLEGAQLLGFMGCGVLQSMHSRGEIFRVSVGGGVALPLGPGNLELTFAQPLRRSSSDVLQKWQLGLRLHIAEWVKKN